MRERWPEYDLLTHRVRTTPDRVALVATESETDCTYRELDEQVDAVAAGLDRLGVSLGTRVGLALETGTAFVRLVHAIARLGGVVVPLNVRKPPDALADQAERADLDVLVCEDGTDEIGHACDVGVVRSIDDTDGIQQLRRLRSATLVPIGRDVDRLAVIMFTSGTTGQPKGVRLTRRNLLSSAEASAYRLGVSPADRWLCCLPMYHMGGLAPIVRTALYGTVLAVQPAFDPETTAAVIDENAVTGVSLVPTMCRRLLDAGWSPPDHLDTVLLGGGPASESLVERCAERDVPVYPTYGLTETGSQVATAGPTTALEYPGTVGQPLVTTTVRVLDDGQPVEAGQTGEIVVSGPTVTPGYLDDARTAAAVDEAGFHTGDLGYRDEDGRLWVVGRVDDRIVSGGENVDPETVRGAICNHPAVEDAVVVGLPDEQWGQRVAALVVGETTPEAVREHCRARLADFEVPKSVAVAETLPRTASGTVDRTAVRERLSANT